VQADLYVFRIVLHVFGDDEIAASILRNVLPAMKDTSRIVLLDLKLDPNAPTAWARMEAYANIFLLSWHYTLTEIHKLTLNPSSTNAQMHSLTGKDRTAEQWAQVVRLASPDLELGKIISSPGRLWSVIEVIRKGV